MATATIKRRLKSLRDEIKRLKADRAKLRFRLRVRGRRIRGLRIQLKGWKQGRKNDAAILREVSDSMTMEHASHIAERNELRRIVEYYQNKYRELQRYYDSRRSPGADRLSREESGGSDIGARPLAGGSDQDTV